MSTTLKLLEPVHPGAILVEDFLNPLGISPERLAQDLHVAVSRIQGIAGCNRPITAEIAIRLDAYFGVAPRTWLNLQAEYDLHVATRAHGEAIYRTVSRRRAIA
jgi:addiction module HigA family antidote